MTGACAATLLGLLALAAPAQAQEALKVIDNPGGGRVVYGQVHESTAPTAMAAVLRYLPFR